MSIVRLSCIGLRGKAPLFRLYVGPWIYTGTRLEIVLALRQDGLWDLPLGERIAEEQARIDHHRV